jgi:hypothetical protein
MFCGNCGTQIKEGAKFCPNCGIAVASAIQKPEPKTESAPAAEPSEPKIDKAVFYHLGDQIYACYMYKSGMAIGNMTDTTGSFIPAAKEWLQNKYPGITVELKEPKDVL